MLSLSRLHHVAIIVSDLDRSIAFYCEVLGFAVHDRNFRADRKSWKVDLRHPSGVGLEVFTFQEAPDRLSGPEALGLRHLAFAVTDLDLAVATLRDRDVAVEPVRTDLYTGKRFTFFADPDGLPLELYEDGAGSCSGSGDFPS